MAPASQLGNFTTVSTQRPQHKGSPGGRRDDTVRAASGSLASWQREGADRSLQGACAVVGVQAAGLAIDGRKSSGEDVQAGGGEACEGLRIPLDAVSIAFVQESFMDMRQGIHWMLSLCAHHGEGVVSISSE
ncbi:hypothetical protein L7F22_007493 [Adiantum nelumboides]|nr:hypothetical protein [Adiantum nelumboides]